MITEKVHALTLPRDTRKSEHHLLKITKETRTQLFLTDGCKEMIFKIYLIDREQSLQILKKRAELSHEGLLRVYKIQCDYDKEEAEIGKDEINCGILLQKYSKTLAEGAKQMVSFTAEEVISTLQPIKDVVDYLIAHNYDPGELSLSSIVCTDAYQIKLIDSYFHKQSLNLTQRLDFSINLYEQLATLLFELLFPHDINVKSWKCRYEIAEEKLKKKEMRFFKDIYCKFAVVHSRGEKTKIIRRNQPRRVKRTEVRRQQPMREGQEKGKSSKTKQKSTVLDQNVEYQQGKQNQIVQ